MTLPTACKPSQKISNGTQMQLLINLKRNDPKLVLLTRVRFWGFSGLTACLTQAWKHCTVLQCPSNPQFFLAFQPDAANRVIYIRPQDASRLGRHASISKGTHWGNENIDEVWKVGDELSNRSHQPRKKCERERDPLRLNIPKWKVWGKEVSSDTKMAM